MTTTVMQSRAESVAAADNFQRYYEEAGPDYAAWSAQFNMHFGFYRWGMNPFGREAMLERMNDEVFDRLGLASTAAAGAGVGVRVLDMGCGLGATLRSFARRLPDVDLQGITLVPWQMEQGRRLNQCSAETEGITLTLGDYERTEHAAASFDAVYAIESSCYARGANKAAFLREVHRLLRPGGRVVIADGFLGRGRLRGPQKWAHKKLCECWVIDTLGDIDQVTGELERLGFEDIVGGAGAGARNSVGACTCRG